MTQKHFKKHSLLFRSLVMITLGFHGGSDGKESTCNARDLCSIPGLGISPGEGNGNRSSILAWKIPWMEEPGRSLVGYSSQGHKESDSTERLNFLFFISYILVINIELKASSPVIHA